MALELEDKMKGVYKKKTEGEGNKKNKYMEK